jgi:hypothetical protein
MQSKRLHVARSGSKRRESVGTIRRRGYVKLTEEVIKSQRSLSRKARRAQFQAQGRSGKQVRRARSEDRSLDRENVRTTRALYKRAEGIRQDHIEVEQSRRRATE